MSLLTPIPPSVPRPSRLVLMIPVIGWIARDVLFGDKDNIWYALVIVLTAFILALATWGLPALVMSALSLVPLCFFMIVYFSKPW